MRSTSSPKVERRSAKFGRWFLAGERRATALLCLILLLLLGNLLSVIPQKSLTNDELLHIPAGYLYWTRAEFRLNPEHPPLAKLWATLPLLVSRPEAPAVAPPDSPGKRTVETSRWFWEANAARFTTITTLARIPAALVTVLLGLLLFWYARRFFGVWAATVAVLLFSLEPTVLAHGRLVHTDIPATAAYLACWGALFHYASRPTPGRAVLLGLASGAAITTKYSLLIMLPALALGLAWVAWSARRQGVTRRVWLGYPLLVGLLILLVLNAVYGFQRAPLTAADQEVIAAQTPTVAAALERGIAVLAPVIPTDYLYGIYTFTINNREGRAAALLGEYSARGWWYYFPVAFALKTPLPFLAITLGALLWGGWRLLVRREWRLLVLLGPLVLYALVAMTSPINIGIRHFLPAYPFLCILGGVALTRLVAWGLATRPGPAALRQVKQVVAVGLPILLVGWFVFATGRAYPNYLPYLNELARGHPAWWYLADSNIEWGEDVGALARYLIAQGETGVVAGLSAGYLTLPLYGVEYRDALAPSDAKATPPRYIAIGASLLNGSLVPGAPAAASVDRFAEYRYRTPEATFGGTIFLYARRTPVPALAALLAAPAYRVSLSASDTPATLHVGQQVSVQVQLVNQSQQAYPRADEHQPRYQLRLGDRWRDGQTGQVVSDDSRVPLPYDLFPEERAALTLRITAPAQPGSYLLEIDLVQEGVAWFGDQGSAPLRLRVRVVP